MSAFLSEVKDQLQVVDRTFLSDLSSYPVDLSSILASSDYALDHAGVPCQGHPPGYDPATITFYALSHWNRYLVTGNEKHRRAFLVQAHWLIAHEVRTSQDAEGGGGWPFSFPTPAYLSGGQDVRAKIAEFYPQKPWLSAVTQGCALSVLARAFQLTRDGTFLDVAQRVAQTFKLDILDGGVSAPISADGISFEELAVYPAAHTLSGIVFGLFGLFDYVMLVGDIHYEKLTQRALSTIHDLLEEFDTGFWTHADLLQRRLAQPALLAHQIALLEALARYTDCNRCALVTARWKKYQRRPGSRLRYQIAQRLRWLTDRVQTVLFPRPQLLPPTRVCISVSVFPFGGGVFTVLKGIAEIMKDTWYIEFLTQQIGPGAEKYIVHQFGGRRGVPWFFPFVWLYVSSGLRKFISLMHSGSAYHVILPQDGVATAALAGLAGKLTGTRVVCIDHGDLSLFTERIRHVYAAEYLGVVASKPWPVRLAVRGLLAAYWPSRYLLGRIAARTVDHFLIPGVVGDSIEEGCKKIGIPASRVTRYGSMIDIDRHLLPDRVTRAKQREQMGVPADGIVIAMVCRLSPEKGITIALESISQALSALPADQRARARLLIAGDGPLRKQVEESICLLGLSQCCTLLGRLSAEKVNTLLGLSDIFLYTSTRGACFAMAVLEAMASGCAVIASTEPLSNMILLAGGRGIAVPSGDIAQTSKALIRLLNDVETCHEMGLAARDYIAIHHNSALFRRNLLRATYWPGLDGLVTVGGENKPVGIESGN